MPRLPSAIVKMTRHRSRDPCTADRRTRDEALLRYPQVTSAGLVVASLAVAAESESCVRLPAPWRARSR
jgi:hypothetical protein